MRKDDQFLFTNQIVNVTTIIKHERSKNAISIILMQESVNKHDFFQNLHFPIFCYFLNEIKQNVKLKLYLSKSEITHD